MSQILLFMSLKELLMFLMVMMGLVPMHGAGVM